MVIQLTSVRKLHVLFLLESGLFCCDRCASSWKSEVHTPPVEIKEVDYFLYGLGDAESRARSALERNRRKNLAIALAFERISSLWICLTLRDCGMVI